MTVAFIGHPVPAKGWPAFCDIVAGLIGDPRLRFLHCAVAGTATAPGVSLLPTAVRPGDRYAMITRLRAAAVDVVLVLSPWPETFCFAAYEAIAAGCLVFCLESSGNVAALVRESGRGAVFPDVAALRAYLADGAAAALRARLGQAEFVVEASGTTATWRGDLAAPERARASDGPDGTASTAQSAIAVSDMVGS